MHDKKFLFHATNTNSQSQRHTQTGCSREVLLTVSADTGVLRKIAWRIFTTSSLRSKDLRFDLKTKKFGLFFFLHFDLKTEYWGEERDGTPFCWAERNVWKGREIGSRKY